MRSSVEALQRGPRGVPYRGSYCSEPDGGDKEKSDLGYRLRKAGATRSEPQGDRPEFLEKRLFSGRFENVIPKGRTHPVPSMIVLIMVPQVVLFQPPPDAAFHGEMVSRVVN